MRIDGLLQTQQGAEIIEKWGNSSLLFCYDCFDPSMTHY